MATIRSVCVVISGLVEGDIIASEQIVLHKSAVVTGNLDSPIVVMEEGSQLNGTLKMGKPAGGAAKSSSGGGGSAKPAAAPKAEQGDSPSE